MTLRVGSLFSGVGGFDLGFEQAGATVAWQCEADPAARRVLRHHWPDVPCHDDVRTVGAHNLTPVDVLVGGFPCQDLSVAGQRKGLVGARSGLFHEFTRIAADLRPDWVLLENVPGLLSSHRGRDFAVVVQTLVECGYGVAWRILDSRHFGVAQRRRRVFLVGCLGGVAERAAAVLFEPTRSSRHPAAGVEAGARVAATAPAGARDAGGVTQIRGGGDTHAVGVHANQRGELRTSGLAGSLTGSRSGKQFEGVMTASTLSASLGHHGHSSPRGDGSDNLVANTIDATCGDWSRAENFNAIPSFQESQSGARLGAEHPTLDAHNGSRRHHGALTSAGVRRLTPRECEVLQGFPPGWTCLCSAQGDTATCVCPDSPRYKQMGNAVTVPVIAWIARRLLAEAARSEAVA